jgi:hypothetical protein
MFKNAGLPLYSLPRYILKRYKNDTTTPRFNIRDKTEEIELTGIHSIWFVKNKIKNL